MTLQSVGGGEHILRLSHQFGVAEDPNYSVPVTVDVESLFSSLSPIDIKELSLTTNQEVSNMKPLQWKTNDDESNKGDFEIVPFDGKTVVLNPADIRTFSFRVPA
jgi:alpha-mannosidase